MSANHLERLARLPSTAVSDALGKRGVVGTSLRRLTGAGTGIVSGRAVTAACVEGSTTAGMAAISEAGPGDVLCVSTTGDWAYLGDVLGAECRRRGLHAIVVDGLVRDLAGLTEVGISVFARGLTPLGGRMGAPGRAGIPILMGGTVVTPGDLIVADDDGVVAVPVAVAGDCAAAAEAIVEAESAIVRDILAGTSFFDLRPETREGLAAARVPDGGG